MVGATSGLPTRYKCPMAPKLAETIRREHNATMQAVHRAQTRALHLGEMLLDEGKAKAMQNLPWYKKRQAQNTDL